MKRSPLNRSSSLQRHTRLSAKERLQTRTELRRTRPLPPVNSARRSRLRSQQFSKQATLCRTLPCSACNSPPPNDPAHVRSRGAGGKDRANVIPLCRGLGTNDCHGYQHQHGWSALWARWGRPADYAEQVARELEEEAYGPQE